MPDRAPSLSQDSITSLRSHPRFPIAMREAAQCLIPMYRSDRLLNALMGDRARSVFAHLALLLHYRNTDNGAPGLTVGAMKDLCVQLDLCSRGRCEAMLALMRVGGFLVSGQSQDRRRRPLQPTEKLFALHRERWGSHYGAMRHVLPRAAHWRTALIDEPDFLKQLILALGEKFVAGFRLLDSNPSLGPFAERNAGMLILFSLALGGADGGSFPARKPVTLSINALATTFSVSRKHVLILLRDAEAEQLLVRGGPANNEVTILPRGRDGLEIFFARLFLYFAEGAADAERALAGCARSTVPVS
ncbi:hypothetical protein I6F35_28655 [Bradyrhizobium sp. BRP22]|uniref:hypothetical protein n=1 Tax=Bradyrhizobium sp. BRP22 TaxID=2793821 RepID=UPI001CD45E63|nr:hypothetical protein [Bradyrhizobium sp. BRP22]MCA1457132.1 hypothetical protein [Bradyrhizobium sp. BRP22]